MNGRAERMVSYYFHNITVSYCIKIHSAFWFFKSYRIMLCFILHTIFIHSYIIYMFYAGFSSFCYLDAYSRGENASVVNEFARISGVVR